MNERVADVLSAAFPDREVAAVGETGPSWNDANRTVAATFADDRKPGRAFLKVALDDGRERTVRERAGGLARGHAERRPVYEAVAYLGVSGYLENYAAYRDEPREELATAMAAEMDRRLARL